MIKNIVFATTLLIFFISCFGPTNPNQYTGQSDDTREQIEDSLELAASYAAQDMIGPSVTPDGETKMVLARSMDDSADDPAIWINPNNPSQSLIYGTNKKGGLAVYDLAGAEIAYYPTGKINNVDVLYNFPLGTDTVSLLGCSNRTNQAVDLYKIDPTNGRLQEVGAGTLKVDPSLIDDIYGFCFAYSLDTSKQYAFINGKNGLLQQFELVVKNKGVHLELVRSIQFDSQTEGMVADSDYGFIYVGEEDRGIWKLGIAPEQGTKKKPACNERYQ